MFSLSKQIQMCFYRKTHLELCPSILTGITQMYAEEQDGRFADFRHIIPPKWFARLVTGTVSCPSLVDQTVILADEIQRDRSIGGHIRQN